MGITLRMSQCHWLVSETFAPYKFSVVSVVILHFLFANSYDILLIQGRIMSKRSSSSKLFFYDLHGDGVKVQVMADARYQCLLFFLIFISMLFSVFM